jgi:hypothetical protein
MFARASGANRELRTANSEANLEREPEREHEPRSKNPEA